MSKKSLNIAVAASGVTAALAGLGVAAESASETMRRAAPALAGIPDRVSVNKASPHFWPHYKKLGVRIDGRDRPGDVHEFCVSEGWALVRKRDAQGQYVHENGLYLDEKIEGRIEPYLKTPLKDGSTEADQRALAAAAERRARKAEKLRKQQEKQRAV